MTMFAGFHVFRKHAQSSPQCHSLSLFEQTRAALLVLWRRASPEKRRRKSARRRKHRPGRSLESLTGMRKLNARLRELLIAPAPYARPTAKACFCHQLLAGPQPLELRLLLTGPTANNDSYQSARQATLSIPAYAGVLANDTGGNGPLSAVLVSGPSHGTLTLDSDGSLVYTNTTYAMIGDSFNYEAFDGTNYSSPATVNIALMGTPQPQVQPQNYSVTHDRTLNVSASFGVLAGSSDPNNVHLTAVLVSGPSHGSVQLNSDGSLAYTPNPHYVGTDAFSFEGYDGSFYSASAPATINVTDQAPTAISQMYSLPNGQTYNVSAAQGVLVGANDPDGDSLTAVLASGPAHGNLVLNSDGSFAYAPNPGWIGQDVFEYKASDGIDQSAAEPVTLTTRYSVLSATDQTKVPVDTIHVSRQILADPYAAQPITSPLPAGGSGGTVISAAPADGAPATAHNLSLVYDSVLASPDQVIEADLGLSTNLAAQETITATLTFNGVAQPPVYYTMSSLNGTTSRVHFAQQIDTSSLAGGRYPWSLTITSPNMAAPATLNGAVNVVNDSASPFGKGWDMPGLYRLFPNSVSGVPAGLLLSTGDGGAWYYTQNGDGGYTSPNGPFAFSTLTSASGGGWQLVTHEGVTFNFNSGGYLTSRVERTGETTTYDWSGNELTSIVDQFGRVIPLAYSGGLLSSIGDFAGNSWSIAHSGTNLISITEPNPGGGSPVWQYAYGGNYMSSETDPNGNATAFTLDSFHRLSQTSLPGGHSTADTSEQDFGYGSASSSSPANLTLATAVNPTSTDANGSQSAFQTNAFGEVVSETDPYGNTETLERDANGLPTVITLPPPTPGAAAPVTNISYTTTGDPISASGAQPIYGTYGYTADSFGQWATFTDTTGDEWVRYFDSKGDILTETDPSGAEVSWTYDAYGRALTMTMPAPNDAAGTVTATYHYDTDERLTEIVWPGNSNEQFGYNADDRETSFQDENGHTTLTGVDVLGRVVSVTAADGGVTTTTYDRDNNVLTTETPMGQVTSKEWSSRNELIQETMPPAAGDASPVLAFTYDANGNELTYTNALGEVTTETWDKLNRLASETSPPPAQGQAGSETTFGYDNDSRKVSETTVLGTTAWAYANTNISQMTSETAPAASGSGNGPATAYFYDADGRQVQVENALSQYTTTTFTVNGQTASVKDNLGDTTTFVHGNGGELLSTEDALHHTTSDQYDSRYRLVQTTNANSGVTRITLDGVGNTAALVDPDGNQTTWTFSPVNLPLTETNALGTTATTYDLDGETTSIQDADGRLRDFVFNNDQQLTAENWMSGGTIVAAMAYGFDLAGNLTSASDVNSAYAFAYNGDGQVTSVDNADTPNVPHVVLASTYDVVGDRTGLSATIAGTADFSNNYAYNDDQQLTMVQQQGANGGNAVSPKETDYGYNAVGQTTSVTDFNFIGDGPRTDVLTGAYSYDSGARITGIAYTSDGGTNTIDTLGWGYNAGSLVTSFTSIDGTADYGYDPTDQLVSATYTTASGGHQPANANFSFDANGNPDSTGYTTGSGNLLTSDGTFNYQHDADGNTTVRTRISNAYATDYRTTYTWDYRNRLTDVDFYDNNGALTTHAHFIYDVFNNLIGEQDDDTGDGVYDHQEFYVVGVSPQAPSAEKPTVEAAQPLLEFAAGGTLTERFLIAPDPTGAYAVMAQGSVASLSQGDVVIWMADDRQGTPRDTLSNSGTLANHMVFSELGAEVYQSDSSVTPWANFAGGHLSAAAQLVLDGLRWYDPHQGRWLSFDPTSFDGGDANLSRYVGNDPTNGLDRTGEISNTQIAAMAIFPWLIPAVLAQEALGPAQPLVAAIPPIGPKNWVDGGLAGAANFSAGFANVVTFNQYHKWNNWLGNGAFVNPDSGLYGAGKLAGWVWCASAAVATWSAAGLPTWTAHVGPSKDAVAHITYTITPWGGTDATTFTAATINSITEVYVAPSGWYPVWFSTPPIPIINPTAAAATGPATSCVGAALTALGRGWLPF